MVHTTPSSPDSGVQHNFFSAVSMGVSQNMGDSVCHGDVGTAFVNERAAVANCIGLSGAERDVWRFHGEQCSSSENECCSKFYVEYLDCKSSVFCFFYSCFSDMRNQDSKRINTCPSSHSNF